MPHKPSLILVTPALADANNGNWQTARRWARLLSGHWRVTVTRRWDASLPGPAPDALLALHARRSADSVAAWAQHHPDRPLVLALTGTDLYRDIGTDASAQASLRLAHRLIVLQDRGPLGLPEALRDRCHVVLQSCSARRTLPKPVSRLRVVMVGHLREEKDPATLLAAVRRIRPDEGIFIDHIGAALDPELGEAAQRTAADCPHYRWLGALPHSPTRERIQRAHLLVHTSRLEGGAHVVMEAVRSGTPVLASHMDGNVGMLGEGYAGYFPVGDAYALVDALRSLRASQQGPAPLTLAALQAQCAHRAPLFDPASERAALLRALDFTRSPYPLSAGASP
ncbi:selenoneine biosynthesis selenosugar synthase SenB [uncultured Hydrogenophaga sp.]|uniref:selenoneine biosynthesis selenosugar synthase SenB n=1 Tax=uncultured Hydrogenophaga sp. TaxID=199683 RepID=UPI00265E2E03|nr:selenoneine biosynthesis selenosugar synthase SenB [uncultured Hydrogenophaga sp.]